MKINNGLPIVTGLMVLAVSSTAAFAMVTDKTGLSAYIVISVGAIISTIAASVLIED